MMTPASAKINGKRRNIEKQWTTPYGVVYQFGLYHTGKTRTLTNLRVLYKREQVKQIRYKPATRTRQRVAYQRKPVVRTRGYQPYRMAVRCAS